MVHSRDQVVVDELECLADAPDVFRQFQAEQGFNHDPQRQSAHFPGHVHPLPVGPRKLMVGGVFVHHRAVTCNAAAMELGLHQPPLLQMVLGPGGHQSIAHGVLEHISIGAAPDQLVMGDYDVPDQVRVVHQQQQGRLERHRNQVPVGGGFLHEPDRVPQIPQRLADYGQFAGSGRQVSAINHRSRRVNFCAGSHMIGR